MNIEKIVQLMVGTLAVAGSVHLIYTGLRASKLWKYKIKYIDKNPKLLKYIKSNDLSFLFPFSDGFKKVDEWLTNRGYKI